jgi:hypothetical protein
MALGVAGPAPRRQRGPKPNRCRALELLGSCRLDTPWFAIDRMAVFSDIREFLDFAESNIEPQKTAALQRIEDDEPEFEDEADAQSYRQHQLQSADFRFEVALPMRIRYAGLMSFIGTVECSMKVIKPTFKVPKKPSGVSETIHLVREFAARCGMSITSEIDQLEFLTWVRNVITHNAGLLKGATREAEIRAQIVTYGPAFKLSDWHFIGETVEIQRGALDPIIDRWSEIIRETHTVATKKKLIKF